MIPISDHNPTRNRPIVTYVLLLGNVLAFLWEWSLVQSGAAWVVPAYGVVPTRFLADPGGELFTVLTSMFMHGGWAHLLGNLLFLYIFGDNVEDAMGRGRYLAFYLASGLVAALAQVFVSPDSTIPMVGASGAIAGVLGGYVVLFPRAPVTVFFGLLWVFPAWIVVGEWFLFNLFRGFSSLGMAQGGVAFFAHIGGFIAGILLIRPAVRGRERVSAQRWSGWRPPPRRRSPGQGWRPPRNSDRWR